jgi:galactokinase
MGKIGRVGYPPPIQLAMICQKAETNYVGVKCGIMDQFASACGIKVCLLLLDCRSLEWRTLPLPKDALIVIADTSLRRSLTNGAYNNRRATCEETVRILNGILPGIQSLRDVTLNQFHRVFGLLPEAVTNKARYIVEEISRTRQAIELLENNDVVRFGELMNASHAGLRDLFEVSCPELDLMVSLAQSFPGCYGARLTGAGFGGCTVNLVARQVAESFTTTISSGYQNMTGLKPEIFICNAVGGARMKTVLK